MHVQYSIDIVRHGSMSSRDGRVVKKHVRRFKRPENINCFSVELVVVVVLVVVVLQLVLQLLRVRGLHGVGKEHGGVTCVSKQRAATPRRGYLRARSSSL